VQRDRSEGVLGLAPHLTQLGDLVLVDGVVRFPGSERPEQHRVERPEGAEQLGIGGGTGFVGPDLAFALPPALFASGRSFSRISAVVPTDVMTPSLARSASAQGLVASPVQIRALMTASVAAGTAAAGDFPPPEQEARRRAQIKGTVRMGGSYCVLYNVASCGRLSGAIP
jgi:hypothetical protein